MTNHKIAEKLDREGQKIEKFFSNLSELQMEINVYLDGHKWKIRDILAHFISAEKSFLQLFENIINGGIGAPDDFSINEFNDSQVMTMKGLNSGRLLVLFKETRSNTLDWLIELSDEELSKIGRHPAMGEATLGEMVKMIYLHNQIHMRDIRVAIESQSSSGKKNWDE